MELYDTERWDGSAAIRIFSLFLSSTKKQQHKEHHHTFSELEYNSLISILAPALITFPEEVKLAHPCPSVCLEAL